jgi:predicted O-linked N-acetylglucosamine transferase (SPINDLY family)
LVNLAAVFQALGEPSRAIEQADRALVLDRQRPEAHNNRAMALTSLHRFDEAIVSATQAIALRQDYAEAHNNLGAALHGTGQLARAAGAFQRAIALQPGYHKAHANLGAVLQQLGRLEDALSAFERALELAPDAPELAGLVLHLRMRLCRWSAVSEQVQSIREQLEKGIAATPPFALLSVVDDPALHRAAASLAARKWTAQLANPEYSAVDLGDGGKIRIGYFSADFFNHATTHLICGLIAEHDRRRFEVIGFSLGTRRDDPDAQRIRGAFDRFIECHGTADADVAQQARALNLDIAIDLKGYTQDARPGIFAAGAAPVQVNFLGYPGTMAAPFMHYLIADDVLVPQVHRSKYDEAVVFMPHSYQVNDSSRSRPGRERCPSRSALGLPEAAFVYCCFNNSFKITPEVFEGWMRILTAVDHSVLWLLADNAGMEINLRAEAAKRAVDPARLVFAPRVSTEEHLVRHHAADLFLDTTPYNAHTTASDALWMSLPVVTRLGESFPARVAASLLRAVGLAELVTRSQGEYEALAISLADKHDGRLAAIRSTLEQRHAALPLFDTRQYARHLESAFETMIEIERRGETPHDIRP